MPVSFRGEGKAQGHPGMTGGACVESACLRPEGRLSSPGDLELRVGPHAWFLPRLFPRRV
jgi:hypothetical protein